MRNLFLTQERETKMFGKLLKTALFSSPEMKDTSVLHQIPSSEQNGQTQRRGTECVKHSTAWAAPRESEEAAASSFTQDRRPAGHQAARSGRGLMG